MRSFRTVVWNMLILCAVGQVAVCSEPAKSKRRIVYHDDAQSLLETPGTGSSAFMREYLRREVSHAPITTFCYLAAMPDICFYDTKVGEVLGDRLSDEVLQIRLDESELSGPSYILGIRGLRAEGTDVLKVVIDELRPRGLEILAEIRMNDTHHKGLDPSNPFCPQFAIDHPQYVIKQPDNRTVETALDYSHPEVRAHRLAIMRELVEEYDIDGLELNFNRWTKHFPRHQGREKAHIMTEFVGQIRRIMDEAAKKPSRKRLTLGVHLPETIRDCWMAGLDPKTWVQNGWIDYLTVSPFNETDPQIKVDDFAGFTIGTNCDLLVSMGDMMGGICKGPPIISGRGLGQFAEAYYGMLLTPSEARAAAYNYYAWGADGISFWNISCNMGKQSKFSGSAQRQRIWSWMNDAASPARAQKLPRRYHFLPIYKGMKRRQPPVRNYAWYAEGQSPSGTFKTQILRFSDDMIGARQVYQFRMADGRGGETLGGTLRFRVFHVSKQDRLTVDINGQVIEPLLVRISPLDAAKVGLPGALYEIALDDCPKFRGDNELGLALETKSKRDKVPYMEELDIVVQSIRP